MENWFWIDELRFLSEDCMVVYARVLRVVNAVADALAKGDILNDT